MRTYKRISAVKTAIDVIKHLSDLGEPVSGAAAAAGLDMQYGTLMCHLVTLEDTGMVRRVGEHWELGDGMALLWARKKARLMSARDHIDQTLSELGE